jgi:beta-lactamase regulating signal transducer with metallopeptidase domain
MIMMSSDLALSVLPKVTVILAAALCLRASMSRATAELRRLALLAGLGSAIILPLMLVAGPQWSLGILPPRSPAPGTGLPAPADSRTNATNLSRTAPSASAADASAGMTRGATVPSDLPAGAPIGPSWATIVFGIWLLGTFGVTLRIGVGHARLRRVASRAHAAEDVSWRVLADEERRRLGVRQAVRLLMTAETTTPVVWGARRPVIVLPTAAERWPECQRRAVLCHELAHVARRDALVRWWSALLCSMYWFHPLAWVLASAIRAESESVCDDDVLATGMPADEYATHLVSIARATHVAGRPAFLAVGMARRSEMARRILAILDDTRRRRPLSRNARRIGLGAATSSVLVLAAGEVGPRSAATLAAQTASGAAARNQAGRVVSHDTAALRRAPAYVLEATPLVATAAAPLRSDLDLRYVDRSVLLSDGRIAALRGIDPRLFVFGTDGRLQRQIGRLGTESGTFMVPNGMLLLPGDTLYVPDLNNHRVNWITAEGGFVRTASLPRPRSRELPVEPRGYLRGGSVVAFTRILGHEVRDSIGRPQHPVIVMDPLFTERREIATAPGHELVRIQTNYRGLKRQLVTHLRLGRFTDVVAFDSLIAIATGERGHEVELRDPSGTLVRRIRIERPRRPVTRAMRDAMIAGELARIAEPQSERFVDVAETRRQARENPFADSLPPFSGIFATPGGRLWAVDAIATGDREWTATAFRSDGSIAGRLRAALPAVPMYFTDDRVLLRASEPTGRTSLRVHRIVPAAAR